VQTDRRAIRARVPLERQDELTYGLWWNQSEVVMITLGIRIVFFIILIGIVVWGIGLLVRIGRGILTPPDPTRDERPHGAKGSTAMRNTAFMILAALILYAAFTGVGP